MIDGPYDAVGLNKILAQPPISLGNRPCKPQAGSACEHGTFVMGLLGARRDAPVPGICPDCKLLHIPLFSDDDANGADVSELASAVELAVAAGARLINLSLAVLGDDRDFHVALGSALDRAYAAGSVIVAAAGNQGRPARGELVSHPATIPVVAVDARGQVLPSSNLSPEIARRGVAMFGSDVLGYGLGGELTRMSGTSAAAAIATGILVAIFGSRSDATVSDMRAAIARLGPRGGEVPPMLDYAQIIAALDAAKIAQNGMGYKRVCLFAAKTIKTLGGIRSCKPAAMSDQQIVPVRLLQRGIRRLRSPGRLANAAAAPRAGSARVTRIKAHTAVLCTPSARSKQNIRTSR
ncbi:MAG: S8 family serine peptidase [Xanthobacteraceae bacterium]